MVSARIHDRRLARPVEVALIAKPGGAYTGVGRYVATLHETLHAAGAVAVRVAPSVPPLPGSIYGGLRRLGVDLRAFWLNYPLWAKYPSAQVYHITSQNLASLLCCKRLEGRVIVTVHDIIPFMLRNTQLSSYRTVADRWFDRLAMLGLKRADVLIADSQATKQSIVDQLGIAPHKINVVYLGIDHDRFQPRTVPRDLDDRYGLVRDTRYLIYVGSEDPRKNLAALLRALAIVRREQPDVELIKVGRPHFVQERRRLIALAAELGVAHAIRWLDDVAESDLPLLYNRATVCVMPSLYEGFGFPALEAMACGAPVVAANATSLPEIVGQAGILVPDDPAAFATAITRCLTNPALHENLRAAGVLQAARFTWNTTIAQTRTVYGL